MISARLKNASLSQAMLTSLMCFSIAWLVAAILLWFGNSRFERSLWSGAGPAGSSEADISGRRSALAAEFAADIAFVQIPLSGITLIFLAFSVSANNRSLKLAREANSTAIRALELEEKTRKISLRAYLHPTLSDGTALERRQFLDAIAPAATFVVSLDNSGQTPATKIKLFSVIRVTDDVKNIVDIEIGKGDDFSDVAALKSYPVTLRQAVKGADDVNLPKQHQLYLRLHVSYEDVFGEPHGFDFTWEMEQTSKWFEAFRGEPTKMQVNVRTLSEHCRSW